MYGTLQVIDVSDIEHPKSVAWYKPENGGVHNVWQAADTLYMGAYDAGFHVFDISGELKGDLRAQEREMASLNTADMGGVVQNAAFDWGVVVNPKDGLAYVNDFNNGLWVVRVNPQAGPKARPCLIALLAARRRAPGAPALSARPGLPGVRRQRGNDRVSLVRFGPGDARVEREQKIGINPTELVGPHGLYVSPDGRWYYVTTAQGRRTAPCGSSPRHRPAGGPGGARRFPATLQVAPGGHFAWTVNFNLYGDKTPSSVSVVWTDRCWRCAGSPPA